MRVLSTRREPRTQAAASIQPDEGAVIAGVHPGSGRLDEIVGRARSLAEEQDVPVVFVMVVHRQPRGDELERMRERLRRYGYPCHLVATWIASDGLSARGRDDLVGRELAAAAERLSASAIVVGHGPAPHAGPSRVVSTLAARLADSTELCIAPPPGVASTFEARRTRGDDPWSTSSEVAGAGRSPSAARC
jgi:hypothetical protein